MLYGILADIVVLLHFLFILFVILGALLALCWRWSPLIHVPAVIWGAYISFYGVACPLTPLEKQLRGHAGELGYSGGFIEHYIIPLIYPAGLEAGHQLILGMLAVLINIVLYGYVIRRRWHQRAAGTRF